DDQLWAVPFQRSTAIMLYNKEAFREAGLDPDKYPLTWDELADYAKKLTKDNNGTKRWGIGIPGTPGTGQWLFSAMSAQNGQRLASDDGTTTYFDDPKVVGALDFWLKLETDGVHPDGVLEYGTSSTDFVEGRFAM